MSVETIVCSLAKVAERIVLGPSAANKAEAETRPQQVAQCQRCPKSGYPQAAVMLAQAG